MALLIDAHCHPTLKHYLFGHSIYDRSFSDKEHNYTNIQVTVPALEEGEVDAVLAAHLLPEKEILHDWRLVQYLKPVLKIFVNYLFKKMEGNDAFGQTIRMIDDFETHITSDGRAKIAHNFAELQESLEAGKKVFVHTLEGAHHLGRGLSLAQYRQNIELLKSKGVALIILGHFYPNDIAYPVEGIPPKTKCLLGIRFNPLPSMPLTEIGRKIVSTLLDKGFIIDLTHTNPTARAEIFQLNRTRENGMRPLIFSHVGVRALFKDHKHPRFALMNPDDKEILAVKECNGVIGIIFMNYWLCGKEEGLLSHKNYGFPHILDTIKHIAAVTGSFDHIAIGTDFDGMTDPPDDFYGPDMLSGFKQRLYEQKESLGATDDDIEKILGKNVLRVLNDGWK